MFLRCSLQTNQGIKNFTNDEAIEMSGKNPDYATQDLYDAIEKKDFPSWTLYLQIMTLEQAKKLPYNPFDLTKVSFIFSFIFFPDT